MQTYMELVIGGEQYLLYKGPFSSHQLFSLSSVHH